MITLEKYQTFIEVVILKSPEELSLSTNIFKGLYGNAKIDYSPEKRILIFRLNNSIDDKKFGEIIRYLLQLNSVSGYNSSESSYCNSMARWKRYR